MPAPSDGRSDLNNALTSRLNDVVESQCLNNGPLRTLVDRNLHQIKTVFRGVGAKFSISTASFRMSVRITRVDEFVMKG